MTNAMLGNQECAKTWAGRNLTGWLRT